MKIHCRHCDGEIRDAREIDPNTPWIHASSNNTFCDVREPGDAVDNAGLPGRTEAEPSELYLALDYFLETWGDGYLADDVGKRFTCTELEALARLFEAAEMPNVARDWRVGHAEGDDDGDLHNPDGSIREEVTV